MRHETTKPLPDRTGYERPGIAARERIAALLDSAASDPPYDAIIISDSRRKEHVVPVVWADETRADPRS